MLKSFDANTSSSTIIEALRPPLHLVERDSLSFSNAIEQSLTDIDMQRTRQRLCGRSLDDDQDQARDRGRRESPPSFIQRLGLRINQPFDSSAPEAKPHEGRHDRERDQ